MKTSVLFPYRFKKIGWYLFVPALIAGVYFLFASESPEFLKLNIFAFYDDSAVLSSKDIIFGVTKNNIFDEITGVLLIISLLLIAFSKQKDEDEFITKIRLESLVWATYINYGILLVSLLFVYGFGFFWVMIFNMFTTLIFFIIRFNWQLHLSNKTLNHAK